MIIRPDIYLPEHDNWSILETDVYDNRLLCLSRFETNKENKIWKDKKEMSNLFSKSQDCWIFKSPIKINNNDNYETLLYDSKNSEIILNNIFIKSDLSLYNNTDKYKILRLSHKYPDSYDDFRNVIEIFQENGVDQGGNKSQEE